MRSLAVEDCCQLSEKCPSDLGRLSMNCEDCAELLDTSDVRHLRISSDLQLGQVIDAASTADECTARKRNGRVLYGVTEGQLPVLVRLLYSFEESCIRNEHFAVQRNTQSSQAPKGHVAMSA